jgi:hypothetical protein
MLEDLLALHGVLAHLRARVHRLRHDETGGLSLEWVAVIIGILTVAAIVVSIVLFKASTAAESITIP